MPAKLGKLHVGVLAAAAVFASVGPAVAQRCVPVQLTAPGGVADDRFGSGVAVSGGVMVIGAYNDTVGANAGQGSASVFRWNGASWAFEATLTASDGAAGDAFGLLVGVDGDTILVGSVSADVNSAADRGAAYVFVRSGGVWNQQAKLVAFDGAAGDHFGSAAALSGDTALLGAQDADISGDADRGAAYVFVRSGGVWNQQAKLTASDGAALDVFGYWASLEGDTAVVGAPGDNIGSNINQGSAYVFVRSGAVWSQQAKLTASDGAAQDQLGWTTAISGETVVVGANLDDVGAAVNAGSAYVFVRSGGVWTQQAHLTDANAAADSRLGSSVGVSGDAAVIGANGEGVNGVPSAGAAHVFERSGTAWAERARLAAPGGATGDLFGFAAAISGDVAVVGAYGDDAGANIDQGSAWVFTRSGGGEWIGPDSNLVASDGEAGDVLGVSVAIAGDTAIAGANFDNVGATADRGSAYVFVRSAGLWSQQAQLLANDGVVSDQFGRGVAVDGDTAVVGARNNAGKGAAYVFVRSGGVWTQQAKLTASDGAGGDSFGFAVAVRGDTAVVGAFSDTVGANAQQGSAYVFVRTGTVWTQQAKLTASDGAASDSLGGAVAVWGDTVIAGAVGDNSAQGSAYVFERAAGVWTQQGKLTAGDGAASDFFGRSVAVWEDTVAVGADGDDIGAFNSQGSAYVFVRSTGAWTQQTKLTAGDGASNYFFGTGVGVEGNLVVVGAQGTTVLGQANRGAAYTYARAGTSWAQTFKLISATGSVGDQFGASVGLSNSTAVVGAYGFDVGANTSQGEAFTFDIPAGCCPPGIDRYYVGPNNGLWNNSPFWSATPGGAGGAGAPLCGNNAFITSAISTNVIFNVLYAPPGINSLTIDGTGGAAVSLTQSSAGTRLAVSGNEYIGVSGAASYVQSAGTNSAQGTVYIGVPGGLGSYDLQGGTLSAAAVVNNGSFTVHGGATLDVPAGLISGSGITYSGAATLTGGTVTAPISTTVNTVITKASAATLTISAPQTYAVGTTFESLAGTTVFTRSPGTTPALGNLIVHANATKITVTLADEPGPKVSYCERLASNTPGEIDLIPGTGQVMVSHELSIDLAEGRLDIGDNTFILDHSDVDLGVAKTALIHSYIQSGRGGGTWTGTGILSKIAGTMQNAAVGMMNNDPGTGTPIYTTFHGVPTDASSILVQYVLYGDGDLDGDVDPTDLGRWIQGLQGASLQRSGLTSNPWYFGDFNYDGVIDMADLSLLAASYAATHGGNVTPLLNAIAASSLSPAQKAAANLAICTARMCVADFNGSCVVSPQDVFDFLSAYFANCTGQAGPPCNGRDADVNNSGTLTVQDVFTFLTGWFAGCP